MVKLQDKESALFFFLGGGQTLFLLQHSTSVDLILLFTSHFSNLDYFPTLLRSWDLISSTSLLGRFGTVSHPLV